MCASALFARRHAAVLITLALLLTAVVVTRKARAMFVLDPLLNIVPEEELRNFRYMLALHSLSRFDQVPRDILTCEAVRSYMSDKHAAICPACERYYLSEVQFCPDHHLATREISEVDFTVKVKEWETFRQRYCETSRIRNLTRATAIKLHVLLAHPDQR